MGSIWEGLGIEPGSKVLDVGFGEFEELAAISRLVGGLGVVFGVDIEKSSTQKALSHLHTTGNVKVLAGDSSRIHLPDGSVDVVVFKGVLHEVENVPQALREAKRLCYENGRVVILDFSPFPKVWLRRSNLRWRTRHPWNLFSPPLDKRPGFTREEIFTYVEGVGLHMQRYEDGFASGQFSRHRVPMFLAVATGKFVTTE